jgi:heat shock protein HslJ
MDNATSLALGRALLCAAIALVPLPAASQSAAYTARGQERDWSLTISERTIALTTQNGGRFEAARPQARQVPEGERYDVTFSGKPVQITIAPLLCRDIMSGMPHPDSVTITGMNGALLGCGGAPRALLGTDKWSITEIGPSPILAGTTPTITFFDESAVAGNASCNRFQGTVEMTSEGLRLKKFSTTLMACATDVLQQEATVIQHLKAMHSFDIRADGALILKDAKGGTLVAVRAAK